MCEKIASRFYWPAIKEEVIELIKDCEQCQYVNRCSFQKSSLELHNTLIPPKVMSQIGIDLMKLCETEGYKDKSGFQYIITAQCYFTKYFEFGALRPRLDWRWPPGYIPIFLLVRCH